MKKTFESATFVVRVRAALHLTMLHEVLFQDYAGNVTAAAGIVRFISLFAIDCHFIRHLIRRIIDSNINKRKIYRKAYEKERNDNDHSGRTGKFSMNPSANKASRLIRMSVVQSNFLLSIPQLVKLQTFFQLNIIDDIYCLAHYFSSSP